MQAYHTLVSGDSGSGKTTLLRESFDGFNGLSVFVNQGGADGFDGRAINGATTVRSESAARAASATKLNWVTSDAEKTLEAARNVGIDYRERTGYPCQIILDECQEVMGSDLDDSHVCKRLLHQDRDKGIKFVVATQDPTDLRPNYSALKQCPYFAFVGVPGPFHRGFADYFSLPKSEMPGERYEYVVFEKSKPFEWGVAYRGRTKERYA